ncbi:diphthine--ammonia ligase [Candidatus Poribacteria bacterium]
MRKKVIASWSGGKDSAMALHEIQKTQDYEIVALLTTLTEDYDRVSMHGVRRVLLDRQAELLDIYLEKVLISKNTPSEKYEARIEEVLTKYATAGVSAVVFGDIFLENLREYRENNLSKIGMEGIFPLWERDTTELVHTFIDMGFKTITTCVDSKFLGKEFVGRTFDEQFLSELPSGIDPCGENGEFHSFVYDGPIFREPVPCTKGEIVLRDNRFYFCDVIPD